jgi:hypothetical protein
VTTTHAPEPAYVAARRVLLDVLAALSEHRRAVIVIGAQAIYLRTEGVPTAGVSAFTTDADLALDPDQLGRTPPLEEVMRRAGFSQDRTRVGTWSMSVDVGGLAYPVDVDLLVPHQVAPQPGRRSAGLVGHEPVSARWADGLEAVLVDHDVMRIGSLDPNSRQVASAKVAGPAALPISKLFKIADRAAERDLTPHRRDRLTDRDASDIYRLFQATRLQHMAAGMRSSAASPISGEVTARGLEYLTRFFGRRGGLGIQMATRALAAVVPADTIEELSTRYVLDLKELLQVDRLTN